MEKRAFGKTDMQVSVLGFGGAEIGFEKASSSTVRELLAGAIDKGLNVIDTAECYEGSEELIGNAVSARRSDFYLFTKCGHGATYMTEAWGADQIAKSIDRSLKRLKTDYVDLVQLHSCNEQILRKGEAVEALQRAKKAGKTRYIGYSGDGSDATYAIKLGVFDTLQTSVSIADQQSVDLTIPLAAQAGMGVIAKRPIANAAWRSKTMPENTYIQP
ncbi:MAG: aldo/keto reductase, partial [Terriglobales bacterium]